MRKKVILLLPLTFNDGTAVPQAALDAVYEELFVQYGGYTVAGTVKGAYRMQTGEKQVDDSHEIWVAVEKNDLEDLRKRVSKCCSLLGQETIYVEVTEATIEFIGPQSGEGQPHEQGN